VRYAETDTMGVVYYGNYLTYFEVARVDYLRTIGCSYRDLEDSGYVAAVTEAHCRYLAPARFDDLLEIKVRIAALRGASMSFAYEIRRAEDQRPIAEGTTSHACLNRATLRPTPLPHRLREAVRAFEEPGPAMPPPWTRD
jgi:acyl-CoA thioester hydrolase